MSNRPSDEGSGLEVTPHLNEPDVVRSVPYSEPDRLEPNEARQRVGNMTQYTAGLGLPE